MTSINGESFGKYKILSEIGKGGIGLMEQNMKVVMSLFVGFFLAISAYSQSKI